MIYLHYTSPTSSTLVPADHAQIEMLTEGETLCCRIEADDWEEAVRLYEKHMGRTSGVQQE